MDRDATAVASERVRACSMIIFVLITKKNPHQEIYPARYSFGQGERNKKENGCAQIEFQMLLRVKPVGAPVRCKVLGDDGAGSRIVAVAAALSGLAHYEVPCPGRELRALSDFSRLQQLINLLLRARKLNSNVSICWVAKGERYCYGSRQTLQL